MGHGLLLGAGKRKGSSSVLSSDFWMFAPVTPGHSDGAALTLLGGRWKALPFLPQTLTL